MEMKNFWCSFSWAHAETTKLPSISGGIYLLVHRDQRCFFHNGEIWDSLKRPRRYDEQHHLHISSFIQLKKETSEERRKKSFDFTVR